MRVFSIHGDVDSDVSVSYLTNTLHEPIVNDCQPRMGHASKPRRCPACEWKYPAVDEHGCCVRCLAGGVRTLIDPVSAVGQRVRRQQERLGVSDVLLARQSKVSREHLAAIKKGLAIATNEMIGRFASNLGLTFRELKYGK